MEGNMEITTTEDNLVEKLKAQMAKNILKGLEEKELDEEERQATLVLNKKKIANDAVIIAALVFSSFAE